MHQDFLWLCGGDTKRALKLKRLTPNIGRITIGVRDVDEQVYLDVKALAILKGMKLGDAVTEAMTLLLAEENTSSRRS